MKRKFESQRLETKQIDIGYLLDLFIVKPIKNDSNKIFLFINGLNGDNIMVNYFNYPVFDDKYLITFNNRQHGNNNAKGTNSYKKIINDIKNIINAIESLYPDKKIYLLGESWGGGLAMNLYYKNNKQIAGIFIWNVPKKIINLTQKSNKENSERKSFLIFKVLISFLFGINTYSCIIFPEILTNNNLLRRLISIKSKIPRNNKNSIVAWLTFKPAWKKMFKILEDNNNYNLFYVQSENDALKDSKIIKKLKKQFEHLIGKNIFFMNGTHLLSFDIDYADKLFDLIDKKLK